MRRLFPYLLLLTVAALAGGCGVTDYPAGAYLQDPPLSEANLSHQALQCGTYDKIPGKNTQQLLEKLAWDFDRTESPGPGWCNITKVGNVSAEEARDWFRFIGPFSFQASAIQTSTVPCQNSMGTAMAMKGLDDGSALLINYRHATGYPASYAWPCSEATSGQSSGYGSPANTILGDELSARYYWPHPVNKTPTGVYMVAIDRLPTSIQFQTNMKAFNSDESPTAPARCNNCMSLLAGVYNRAYEMNFHNAALKGNAGLAEFFSGEPLTFNMAGMNITASGRMGENGMMWLKLHSIEKGSSVYTAQHPIEMGVSTNFKQFIFDQITYQDEYVRLYQWYLNNFAPDEAIVVGGFIPETGWTVPKAKLLFNPDAMQYFINTVTSGIDPRQREGGVR